MQKIFFVLCLFCSFIQNLNALIVEAPDLTPFENAILELDQNSFVLFDVDETLIVPKDLILKPCARKFWIEFAHKVLKKPKCVPPGQNKEEYLFGQILAKIEYELVDPKVLDIINCLRLWKIKAIAFTKMATGPLGKIPTLEDWRINHLKKHQIDFSNTFPDLPELEIRMVGLDGKSSLFKQGLLCANKQDKGPVLNEFLRKLDWRPSKILFLDNNPEYLKSVEMAMTRMGIDFVGFHYTAVENRPCVINEILAKFQLEYLGETGEWLSDQEALENLSLKN